jgi:hypothetical protein
MNSTFSDDYPSKSISITEFISNELGEQRKTKLVLGYLD